MRDDRLEEIPLAAQERKREADIYGILVKRSAHESPVVGHLESKPLIRNDSFGGISSSDKRERWQNDCADSKPADSKPVESQVPFICLT
jgi:hypothetical protein